jgi:predicted nucleic acid-binding protein
VVDASAVLPLIDIEPCSGQARDWFAGIHGRVEESATVDLFDAECANALWKRVRGERWPLAVAQAALDRTLRFPLRRVPVSALAGDALDLAVHADLAVYDACYVALSMTTGLPLVTADRRMARAARGVGCDVLCLGEVA